MSNDSIEMLDEFSQMISNEKCIMPNSVLEILKEYSSTISVFDMMAFTSKIIEENKYVQENYRHKSEESYIKSFLIRSKEISKDEKNYTHSIDRNDFKEAIAILKSHALAENDFKTKTPLIFALASIYTTFILKEAIHPVGTPFPGSLKVEEKNNKFYCPVKDANLETPNAVCKICLAEQLDF